MAKQRGADDRLAVDRGVERLPEQRVQQLLVARILLRVGIDNEVVELHAGAFTQDEMRRLDRGHRGGRHYLHPVKLATLQCGDFSIGGTEELKPEAVDVR